MPASDVVLSYDLPASARQAFMLYVDRIGLWWPGTYTADPATYAGVVIEPRVGGRVLARYNNRHADEWGRVTRLEMGASLEHTFTLAHASRVASLVSVSFADHDTGSRMSFRHGGWTEDNKLDRHRFNDWPLILSGYVDLVRVTVRRAC
ncbi:SRPBCC domain-containing protein [Luteipulveratus mongoliensis]|uniref:Activator of Hsp90 ATPase homologue 1/2-like C-terminal domain-containing protein n=1 Tax=Luteipulveratus mongoliensis TaxID=571913 RepID=A0A0K1JK40_9MICO|nr:SRPBCC domain-containing protein [Luteipulveratus mongoliensis]AKU16940.1 hypothetical protein VV02_15545 [Luteipulveratus mongoliensis]